VFLKVIACEVGFREVCACASRSVNRIDLEFLPQGYHDVPQDGSTALQARVDAVEKDKYDAILLGYGLCNQILSGIQARDTPMVLMRAHDCITFFLGSRERYNDVFTQETGTYYFTAGWLEQRSRASQVEIREQSAGMGMTLKYDALVEQYGEENARYLMETMSTWSQHYTRGLFIGFDFTSHLPAKRKAQEICKERGWTFEEIEGDLSLLQQRLDGPWEDDSFLVLPSGAGIERVTTTPLFRSSWRREPTTRVDDRG
jgi:hypothetical protein